jgi:quinol monooxygenase YgiN
MGKDHYGCHQQVLQLIKVFSSKGACAMLRIIARNFIDPQKISEVEPLLRELIASGRKDEGAIEYRLYIDPKETGIYTFIEEWSDPAAHARHNASEHCSRIFPKLAALAIKPAEVYFLTEFQ